MVNYCLKHRVRAILVESGDSFARDLMVQNTGIQWLAESSLQVICVDNVEQTGALVRQMLGAVHEFVPAQARER